MKIIGLSIPPGQVKKVDDCIGEAVEAGVKDLKNGEVLLLENVRFHKEETKNEPEFAKAVSLAAASRACGHESGMSPSGSCRARMRWPCPEGGWLPTSLGWAGRRG